MGISEGRFAEESNWIMRRQFFDKLIEDPIALNLQPEEVRSKIELLKYTEIGKLNQIADLMQNLYQGNLELETQKLTLNENMETLLSQLKDLENRYFNDTEIEKTSILQERNQILDQMNTLQVEIDANSETIHSQLIQKVEAISHLNNSFSTEILPADNEKVTNSLYLKVIALEDVELSPAEESNLSSIAFQCPLQGGSAVYRARSIYEYLYGETEFGNSCDVDQPRIETSPAQIQSIIYPNPAAHHVMLQLPEKDYNSIVKVTFTDMNGRMVKEEICNAVEIINIETLANGLYAVLVKNNISGEILQSQKILISKN
ncbi:MAG: T9SS type A sorting domain-containing protein [Saprospiraceae bacterium]